MAWSGHPTKRPVLFAVDDLLARVRRLFPFAYSVAGAGNDAAVPVLQSELPSFTVDEYPAGSELNGWVISPPWTVDKATIHKNGALIYDGLVSPLGVITQSESFSGTVTLDTLKRHLFYAEHAPHAVVYHCQQLYRTGERSWGFCVPQRLFEALTPGDYQVELVTRRSAGTMKVLDALLPGASTQTIVFNAHNCHPFQANDDISGVAVGIEVMRRLAERPDRRLTYRLVVAPELIGTTFWLHGLGAEARDLAGAILLKAVGNAADLRLQASFTGTSRLDNAAHHAFRHRYGTYDSGSFRTVYGNDETVFEAPGYEIPTVSLTRYPFPTYHTDRDTPNTLSEERLQDTVAATLDICTALECDVAYRRRFEGLVCLSHPRYDLYQPVWEASLRDGPGRDADRRWNRLMTELPRLLDGRTPLLDIADRVGLPAGDVAAYVARWVDKGLAEPVGGPVVD